MEDEIISLDQVDATLDVEELERMTEQLSGSEEQQPEQTAQNELQDDDPRNQENWGVAGVTEELKSAVLGGTQDTLSSVTTFPERTVDAFSGEIARERKEKGFYQPEFDPFVNEEDPIVTKTWWGQLIRGTVHFGTMAAGIVAAVKASPVTIPAALKGIKGYSLLRAAGIGATSDLISKESDGHNALGVMRDKYGWMDTPLSTRDTDHPMWMKFKNIVEGMGIGFVFDAGTIALGKGSKYAKMQIAARNEGVELGTLRKGLQELRKNEFRGSKNKPIAGQHQANVLSEDDPYAVWERQKKIESDWGAEEGSAGSLISDVQKERIAREAGITEDLVMDTLRKLYSAEKFRKVLASVKGSRQKLVEIFGDAIAAHQRMTVGRNAADLSAQEYLQEIFETSVKFDITDITGKKIDEITTITAKNVVVSDLIVGTLLQELRDRAIAGREIADFSNLLDIDGPSDQILDTMLTAIAASKKAKYNLSQEFRGLGAGKVRAIEDKIAKDVIDARESIQSVLKIAGDDADGDLLMALFEAFSSMQTVNTVEDFTVWARKMIKGGEIEGKVQTGAMVRELQGMMIHSILSGPKTPMRALGGTSTLMFLRPLATTLGAGVSYPFTGDAVTIRAGLASLNGMMESLPEAWTIFRTRLNSYWSGELSTVKTRFAEYTREDDNWEVLRRFVDHSPDATIGDKAMFAMANMARNLNDNSFLTWSTKAMASIDDTAKYILGRAKMREKALRSAIDAQNKGVLTAYNNIDRALVKVYEDDFYRQVFDGNGNITDEAVKYASKEVTLTKELTGFAEGLNQVFQANPLAKPFFLFARTGINGLELTAKHTPGFNFLVEEFNHIFFADPSNLENVIRYGITTPAELANAKALQIGRLTMGFSVISMASWAWLSGNLTGNGPADRQKRQSWIDLGYRPGQIRLGGEDGVWVDYELFEPFNQIMRIVADIGDASLLMGEEWTERELQKISLVVAQGITSKSYLAGMQQFVDLFGGRPGQFERIIANLANNQIPLAGIRNELGKIFTPYTRELSSGIGQSIRNRNLLTEHIAGENQLSIKHSILDGKPIRDYDPLTRFFQALFPIGMNLDYSEEQQFLFASGYDMRLSTLSSPGPNTIDLSDAPEVRSEFQEAIGKRGLGKAVLTLSRDRRAQESLTQMYQDIKNGNRGDFNAMDYYHNRKLQQIFTRYRKLGWFDIRNLDIVKELIVNQTSKKEAQLNKRRTSAGINEALYIYK
tara:strand:- start:1355 stop:5053 length:3699 start_codon:yes stop_codon:yes gene_type:complete